MTVMLSTRDHGGDLVRAHLDGRLRGYLVPDAFGWVVVGRKPNGPGVVTVDRYDPYPGEPPHVVRRAALRGLVRYAATGKTSAVGAS